MHNVKYTYITFILRHKFCNLKTICVNIHEVNLVKFLSQATAVYIFILWHVDPFLGNDSVPRSRGERFWGNSPLLGKAYNNTRQQIRRKQSHNFRCYATLCKYKNRRRGVFVLFVYIHCGATDVFLMDKPRDYISGPVVNQYLVWRRGRLPPP
jgi:hypothetical protein